MCSRLGLVNFAPLWRKDQNEYLADLEALEIDSIIVKVAAIGLNRKHLGQRLSDVRGHLEKLQKQFGVHPAGEEHVLIFSHRRKVSEVQLFLLKSVRYV